MKLILLFLTTLLFADEKYLIAQFQNLQDSYYNHQMVHLKLKIVSAKDGNIKVIDNLSRSYSVTKKDDDSYIANINFELNDHFPVFKVLLKKGKTTIDSLDVSIPSEINQLTPPKDFCNVLAKDMKVSDKIMSNYDKNHNIVYFTLKIVDGDGKRFRLNLSNEKISLLEKNNTAALYTYSAIVPLSKNNFEFTYFNVPNGTYDKFDFTLKLKSEVISTQTDIKPLAKTNLYIINAALGVVIVLFLGLFIFKRKFLLLLPIILIIPILVYFNLPKKIMTLQKGTELQLLPFKQSTVFMVLKQDRKVKVLFHKNGYSKVEFDNHIGWVKDE